MLRLKRLSKNDLDLPKYETDQSSGIDFAACLTRTCKLVNHRLKEKTKFLTVNNTAGRTRHSFVEDEAPEIPQTSNNGEEIILDIRCGETIMVPLGWACGFEENFVMQLHVRSSIGLNGLTLANSTGIIDSDYRGELFACLYNRTSAPIQITHGQRIVQAIMLKCDQMDIREEAELMETARGEGGFGSTGTA